MVINYSTKLIALDPKREVAVLDISHWDIMKFSKGFCNKALNKYYSFKSIQIIFEEYNFRNCRNKLQEETSLFIYLIISKICILL